MATAGDIHVGRHLLHDALDGEFVCRIHKTPEEADADGTDAGVNQVADGLASFFFIEG